jgi:hypothetical protein
MPVKRGKDGKFVANGGRASAKGKTGGGKAALAKRGVEHVLARNKAAAKAKKPTKAQARAAALKNAQTKMLAAANKR